MNTRYTITNNLFENFPIKDIMKIEPLDKIKTINLIHQKLYI